MKTWAIAKTSSGTYGKEKRKPNLSTRSLHHLSTRSPSLHPDHDHHLSRRSHQPISLQSFATTVNNTITSENVLLLGIFFLIFEKKFYQKKNNKDVIGVVWRATPNWIASSDLHQFYVFLFLSCCCVYCIVCFVCYVCFVCFVCFDYVCVVCSVNLKKFLKKHSFYYYCFCGCHCCCCCCSYFFLFLFYLQ